MTTSTKELYELLKSVKDMARRFRVLTGRPLGVTGEVAEYEAAKILGLTLCEVRQSGYDATYRKGRKTVRTQIKGRCLLNNKPGQRVGSVDVEKEWDTVILVLLDSNFDATSIFEADRESVLLQLNLPGSKARNERHSLSINQFKRIGRKVWPLDKASEF